LALGLFLALAGIAEAPARPGATRQGADIAVIDGDTLRVGPWTLDLAGIAAPPPGTWCDGPDGRWPCGETAALALRLLTRPHAVTCTVVTTLGPTHALAECRSGGESLADRMVAEGLAVRRRDGSALGAGSMGLPQ
jgi:endonuclease YncB( thermonuclease family)